jgi:hypothetical protein
LRNFKSVFLEIFAKFFCGFWGKFFRRRFFGNFGAGRALATFADRATGLGNGCVNRFGGGGYDGGIEGERQVGQEKRERNETSGEKEEAGAGVAVAFGRKKKKRSANFVERFV